MPVLLLTLHAYGTWLPDREQGSVHWQRGYQSQNLKLAREYRYKQRQPAARLSEREQRVVIDNLIGACPLKSLRLYAAATDESHVHILLSWRDEREPMRIQDRVKHSLTRALNEQVFRRRWFTKSGHRKCVNDREHFDHLRDVYLPSHKGLLWDERHPS